MLDAYLKVGASLLSIMGVIITIDRVIDILNKIKGKTEIPLDSVKKDIIVLQSDCKQLRLKGIEYEKFLKNDNIRISELELGMKVLLKANQGLIRHALTENNVEQLKELDKQLDTYIWK